MILCAIGLLSVMKKSRHAKKPYKIRIFQDENSNERLISYGIEKGDKICIM